MRIKFIYLLLLVAAFSCKESYDLPGTVPAKGYLVVEGIINSDPAPTTIRLTRTVANIDTANLIYEHNATVSLEGNDNSVQLFAYQGNGNYRSPALLLDNNVQYRLHIKTISGEEYLSDAVTPKSTPPIDTINWERNNGVNIFVNTHDPQNDTRYYYWQYEETWEFHSAYFSLLKYVSPPQSPVLTVVERPIDEGEKLYYCWKTRYSTSILLGSSAKFTKDSIHEQVMYIQEADEKISVLYSLLVRQYALTREHYEYLSRMKKNTEELGSIFDVQPSELKGNIHRVDKPDETVIGYIGIANPQEKRLWIRRSEVPGWFYNPFCPTVIVKNHPDSIEQNLDKLPTDFNEFGPGGNIVDFLAASRSCVDCTLRGTNVKPSFWP